MAMRRAPTMRAPSGPIGWGMAGLLLVLLLGIIGMHGVGPHGVGAHPAVAVVNDGATERGHMTAGTTEASNGAVFDADGTPTTGDHRPTGLLELCMAALVGFAVLLLIGLTAGRWPGLRLRIQHLRIAAQGAARSSDPPDLTRLSLLRC